MTQSSATANTVESTINRINQVGDQAFEQIKSAPSLEALEQIRISFLGKKGALSDVLKGLSQISSADRPQVGSVANSLKKKIEDALSAQNSLLEESVLNEKLRTEKIDVTLSSRAPHLGSHHLIHQTIQRVVEVFGRVGFDVTVGPEVETEFYNFEAVNIPKNHPARDMQDTLFLGPGVVLRTHTSSVQMRMMKAQSWPLRILCPGTVYRRDDVDATHSPMFHQIEGLWVDRGVRMSDLKGTLQYWAREMFGPDTEIRLRPSYFPFVEPGAEVDVSCFMCRGKKPLLKSQVGEPGRACPVCKNTGWVEVLGAGMVHPRLFEMAGYDRALTPDLTGFAFGMGVERIAMLLHQIPDIRYLYSGDARLLGQF